MPLKRVGIVVAIALAVGAVGEAASPPRDRLPPTKPTVDGSRETEELRPIFHFGARDNRTLPSQIRFRCAVDSPLLHPCARIYRPSSNLAFGQHALRVRAIDRAGNTSGLTAIAFTVVGSWDAAVDFPRAPRPENPAHDKYGDTAWFYLYGDTPVHNPTQYRPLPVFHVSDALRQEWTLGLRPDGTILTPLVGALSTEMIFHPERNQFAILGWRSPYTGKVSLELRLRFADPTGQATSNGIVWSLDRDGSSLRSELLTPAQQAQAAWTLDVNAGDTFYLVIDDAGDSRYDTTVGTFRVRTLHE